VLLLRVELQGLLHNRLLRLLHTSSNLLLLLLLTLSLPQLCSSCIRCCCGRLHAAAPALLARVLVVVTIISLFSSVP
jgi:hypothetical protein